MQMRMLSVRTVPETTKYTALLPLAKCPDVDVMSYLSTFLNLFLNLEI